MTRLVIFLIQILGETDIEQTLEDAYNEALHDVEKFDEISSLCKSSETEFTIDDFENSKKNIKKIHEHLFPKVNIGQEKEQSICQSYFIRYKI